MKSIRNHSKRPNDERPYPVPAGVAVLACRHCYGTKVCPYCHGNDGKGCAECGHTGRCPWCYEPGK